MAAFKTLGKQAQALAIPPKQFYGVASAPTKDKDVSGERLLMQHCLYLSTQARKPSSRRVEVTSDPDDNIFVECADAARADFLITGNRKHFPAFWKNTKIVTPREFVSLVAPHLIR